MHHSIMQAKFVKLQEHLTQIKTQHDEAVASLAQMNKEKVELQHGKAALETQVQELAGSMQQVGVSWCSSIDGSWNRNNKGRIQRKLHICLMT